MILVYIETAEGKAKNVGLEMINAAKALTDKVAAVVVGAADEAVKQAASYGADEVITVPCEGYNTDAYCYIFKALVEKYSPEAVFVGGTLDGKDFAPRLAAKLGAGCVTDVVGAKKEDGKVVYTCPVYGGTVLNDMVVESPVAVAIIRSGAFKKADPTDAAANVVAEEISVPAEELKTKIAETVKEISETVNIEEAEVIVSGGRGMGAAENFALLNELADLLGGVVGATRAPIESGWISRAHQIGQSGKIVATKLYIACGISGATQHVSGMIGSDYIVAINKDEDAPIFDIANVGIVGNVLDVIPLMIEEIKKAKA